MTAINVIMVTLTITCTASASGFDVLYDCGDDEALSRVYSVADYRDALDQLPTDGDEYTACRDVIRQAMLEKVQAVDDTRPHDVGRRQPNRSASPAPARAQSRLIQASADPLLEASDEERDQVRRAIAYAPSPRVVGTEAPLPTADDAKRHRVPASLEATFAALGLAVLLGGGTAGGTRRRRPRS